MMNENNCPMIRILAIPLFVRMLFSPVIVPALPVGEFNPNFVPSRFTPNITIRAVSPFFLASLII